MVSWRRRDPARAVARGAADAPSDLRVHLPLLWPAGPDGPVDDAALQALAREYARTGRSVEDLLADLDRLCSVLGIGTPSRVIETSSVAWADAFLETVGSSMPPYAESLAEVERRLQGGADTRLLVVSWPGAGVRPEPSELDRVVEEVRRVFPGAAVAAQAAAARVLAAVDGDDVETRADRLRARSAELGRTTPPTVEVLQGPTDAHPVRALFRDAG